MMDFSHIPALKTTTILEATWTDCPAEVKEDISNLWQEQELGNDTAYYAWDQSDASEEYPNLTAYLDANNIKECLIHYWW